LHARLVAVFEGGLEVELQPHDQRSPITRDGFALRWSGSITAPNGAKFDYTAAWETQPAPRVDLAVSSAAESPVLLQAIEWVVDLPRPEFVGGTLQPGAVALPDRKPADARFVRATTDTLEFAAADGTRRLSLTFPQAREFSLADHWAGPFRSYRLRVPLHRGPLAKETVTFSASLQFDASGVAALPATVQVDPAQRLAPFDGFGGNLCWAADNPETQYILEHLRLAWSRH